MHLEDSRMNELRPVIVFALFPGVTQLDFTGPHEVFSSLPAPPFNAGSPDTAPPAVVARVRERMATFAMRRRGAVETAAARLTVS